ncbi:MAG: prolyl oligopeptidase family serine peptidase [Sedimentisphaerales bacterium]|nr:prolyl oligopeptidase family serine peptidase [Sedimentisphaerales bacterium]
MMQRRLLVPCCLAISLAIMSLEATARPAESAAFSPPFGLLLTAREVTTGRGGRGAGFGGAGDLLRGRLLDGTLSQFGPEEGQTPQGQERLQWRRVEFGPDGAVAGRGSYLYAPVSLDQPKALILKASGHSEMYVNGEPRGADIYTTGYVHLPVLLHKGTNHLLLRSGRGAFNVRLYPPPAPVCLHREDTTLPDLVVGQKADTWGAVVVINATSRSAEGFTLTVKAPGLIDQTTPVPPLAPVTVRKTGFRIQAEAPLQAGKLEGTLELRGQDGVLLHSIPLTLEVVAPDQRRRITFVSEIDGSIQYFSLLPAGPVSPDDPPPAIVLSCHGAGVEAHGQAGAYSPKRWFHIVAPTNRRPYGYDWEDFGRGDAMEVLDLAGKSLKHDPSRIYVTGHSMGGHGAWHLGVTYPDRFAAVGPSAGWLSRSTYGGRRGESTEESTAQALVSRCQKSGDTIALSANLKQHGVYILHGGGDDNVPPSQARRMAEVLKEFHHDWVYHEEPGQGHWWGNDYGDGGSACVEWPFMFDLFARHALPPSSAVGEVEFVTANPGVSSRCHWLAIEGQIRHLDLSKAHIHAWPNKRLFKGTTENVAILRLDVRHLHAKEPVTVELDGQTLPDLPYPNETGCLWLRREKENWRTIEKPSLRHKGPHRYGAIKDELRHRLVFVYGTRGTIEENAWAFNKARLDAETFWYRGNGSVPVVEDVAFEPSRYPDRTVVLYGNAQTNDAWSALLGESPVQVRREEVRIGDRFLRGGDLSVIFLRPRQDSDVASVAVVSGTGPVGMRATYPVSFFTSFVRYPDCLITRPDSESARGSENVAVGFFGLDWSVENGEFAFAER